MFALPGFSYEKDVIVASDKQRSFDQPKAAASAFSSRANASDSAASDSAPATASASSSSAPLSSGGGQNIVSSSRVDDIASAVRSAAPAQANAGGTVSLFGLHGVTVMPSCDESDGYFLPPLVSLFCAGALLVTA